MLTIESNGSRLRVALKQKYADVPQNIAKHRALCKALGMSEQPVTLRFDKGYVYRVGLVKDVRIAEISNELEICLDEMKYTVLEICNALSEKVQSL